LFEAVAPDFGLAQYTLGLAYANGTGVPQDRTKALEWFRLAESYGMGEATEQIAALEQVPNPNAIDLAGFGREGPGY
jgi:TPR repeat protein